MPVDCDPTVHNLLILPTSCVVMAHGLGIYSLSGAPIFSMAYPKLYLARFPIGHTVVTMKPQSWLLYAAETANIRCRSGLAATTDRKAFASSTMQNRGREKKKSWLNNAGISAASTYPVILPKYWFDIKETSQLVSGPAQQNALS